MIYISNMLEFLETIKWRDSIDIMVIAFLLYRCFILFRGTMVLRAIIGVTLLWILTLLATISGLIVTSLILKGLGAIVVIVVIVVFRNEIRGVISSTNPLNLFFGKPRRRRVPDYGSISRALFALAEKRVGAIVVFGRKDNLEQLIQGGVRVGAVFSQELLFSIFDNKSPLHDGALIMEGIQIQIAAAFLPLTLQQALPIYYGSRHRAALGISERSDAVVVVVSEERGEVSLVKERTIEKIETPVKLSSYLENLLEGSAKKEGVSIRAKRFVQDVGVKIVFLVLALFIWVFFAGEKESFISYTFPIEFRDLPKNFELVKISAQKAEVQISGSRRLLLALKPEQVALSLDLKNSEAGKNSFPLTSKNLSIPPGLNVIKIEPDSVTVVMEERTTALVPVVADLVGTLPEGKEMLFYKVIPDKVTIVGAPSVLRGIFSVKTEPILLSSITESTTVEVGVIPSPASVKLSSESLTVVEVELVIKDKVKKGRVESGGGRE